MYLVPYVGNDFLGTGFDDIVKIRHFDDTVVIIQFAGCFFLFGVLFIEGVTVGFFQAFGFFLLHLQGGDVTRDAVASQRQYSQETENVILIYRDGSCVCSEVDQCTTRTAFAFCQYGICGY